MRYRYTMNLFYISLPICLLLRTIQLIFTIDETTGFIKQQYSSISTVIMIVICAAVAAVGLLGLIGDGIKAGERKLSPAIALTSVLAGGMFIYDTVTSLTNLNSSSWYDLVLIILGVLSAIVFILYGLKNVYDYNMPSMMLVIPVFYYILKLITIFVSTSDLALVTENIFLLFTNGALLLFMFEFAKFENNIGDSKKENKKLFATGIISVMLCAISTVPKIIGFLVNKTQPTSQDISSALLAIVVGVFVLLFIICNFSDKANKRKKHIVSHLAQ